MRSTEEEKPYPSGVRRLEVANISRSPVSVAAMCRTVRALPEVEEANAEDRLDIM